MKNKNKPIKILSLDNSSKTIGWAFFYNDKLNDSGFKTIPGSLADDRMLPYWKWLKELIRTYKPDMVVIESCFSGNRGASKIVLPQYMGICKLACKLADTKYTMVSPTQAKLAYTGDGKATKQDMIDMTEVRYGLKDITDDEADAIALGYTYYKGLATTLD